MRSGLADFPLAAGSWLAVVICGNSHLRQQPSTAAAKTGLP